MGASPARTTVAARPAASPQAAPKRDELDFGDEPELDEIQMIAELREQRRRLDEAERRLSASGFEVRSGDGLLGVSVERGVAVVGINISPEAVQQYSPEELGDQLAGLVGEAINRGAELYGAAFSATSRGDTRQ